MSEVRLTGKMGTELTEFVEPMHKSMWGAASIVGEKTDSY